MIVIPNNGSTTTLRPLLKIRVETPLAIGSELRVLRGSTVLGNATLASDQQGEPGLHYEYRDLNPSIGANQYSAEVYTNGSSVVSPLYTIQVVPLIVPTVTGVYEQEILESGLTIYCPVFAENNTIQYKDFGIRIVITPDEPSGVYPVTTNADAGSELTTLGLEVDHMEGDLTIVELMASELHDWFEALWRFEHVPEGSEWTLNWPDGSEKTSVATVLNCGNGV